MDLKSLRVCENGVRKGNGRKNTGVLKVSELAYKSKSSTSIVKKEVKLSSLSSSLSSWKKIGAKNDKKDNRWELQFQVQGMRKLEGNDDERKNGMVNQLICKINEFKVMVRLLQRNEEYDVIIGIRRAIWLSPFEIMVFYQDAKVKIAMLHSHEAIPKFVNSPSKLAICSKCKLMLYDDIEWYLKWKFL